MRRSSTGAASSRPTGCTTASSRIRRARSLYERNRPSLDSVQLHAVKELHERGCALVAFGDLFPEEVWQAVAGEASEFVEATESGLEGNGDELRLRAGKEFLVRKYDMGGVVGLDNPWLRASISRRLLDVANEYLQLWSKLEYVDLWYSLPAGADAERKASQNWHRDYDDRHLLKAFLYLSDVDEQAGPFEYVPGSQPGGLYAGRTSMAADGLRANLRARACPARVSRGRADVHGAAWVAHPLNTSGLHRGGFAEAKRRVLAAATYCSPASLASLTQRNYTLASGTDLGPLDPVVRHALS